MARKPRISQKDTTAKKNYGNKFMKNYLLFNTGDLILFSSVMLYASTNLFICIFVELITGYRAERLFARERKLQNFFADLRANKF